MQEQAVGPRARANITLEILHKTRANMRVVKEIHGSYGSGRLVCLSQLHGMMPCICILNVIVYAC